MRKRAKRNDLNAGIFVHGLNERVDGMTTPRTPLCRLVPVIAKAVDTVEPIRNHQLSQQRGLRAGINRDVRAAQFCGNRALLVACATGTLPATTVMAATRTLGERRAMMSATASSEAVSVSIKNVRVMQAAPRRGVAPGNFRCPA